MVSAEKGLQNMGMEMGMAMDTDIQRMSKTRVGGDGLLEYNEWKLD